ncbi:MAG TPA: P-II family nitrogen regulator [Geobacteraceae bacterium]
MKLVEAIIKPAKLDEVKEALQELGVAEIVESEVTSHFSRKIETMSYRGAECLVDFIRKIRLEVVAADELVSRVVKTIGSIAGTGQREDCRILILTSIDAY